MSKSSQKNSSLHRLTNWLIFAAGIVFGVFCTRLAYDPDVDLTSILLILLMICMAVFTLKVKKRLSKQK